MKIKLDNDYSVIIYWKHKEKITVRTYYETKCFVELYLKNRDTMKFKLTGVAICSIKDIFTKERGRKLSLKRALNNVTFNKEDRTKIWLVYLTNKKKFKHLLK